MIRKWLQKVFKNEMGYIEYKLKDISQELKLINQDIRLILLELNKDSIQDDEVVNIPRTSKKRPFD